jgi:small subunit ribosomal protein S11
MADEKSEPKKEKNPSGDKKAGKNPGAPAGASRGEGPQGSAKGGGKAAAADAGTAPAPKEGKGASAREATADGAAPAAPAKPVEMIGGVAKQPTAEDLLKEELGTVKVRKAKGSKNVTSGVANVLASFNNTIVSITDLKGQVIAWSSAGKCNFRGSRKSTAYAAQVIAQDAARNAMAHGLKDVVIRVSGPGLGRDSAIRALQAIGLEVTSIVDVTPIPHNGCRPRKRRRV